MDTLAAYDSDDSDSDDVAPNENPPMTAQPTSASLSASLTNTKPSCEPVSKRPRPSSSLLSPPPIDGAKSGGSMVLWPEDYLTAKLDEAERMSRNGSSASSGSLVSSLIANIKTKPNNWLDQLSSDPDFTNPHQMAAVASELGIRSSVVSREPLQAWETVDRLQELDREALIQAQTQNQ